MDKTGASVSFKARGTITNGPQGDTARAEACVPLLGDRVAMVARLSRAMGGH